MGRLRVSDRQLGAWSPSKPSPDFNDEAPVISLPTRLPLPAPWHTARPDPPQMRRSTQPVSAGKKKIRLRGWRPVSSSEASSTSSKDEEDPNQPIFGGKGRGFSWGYYLPPWLLESSTVPLVYCINIFPIFSLCKAFSHISFLSYNTPTTWSNLSCPVLTHRGHFCEDILASKISTDKGSCHCDNEVEDGDDQSFHWPHFGKKPREETFRLASSKRPSYLMAASPHQLGFSQTASLSSSGLTPAHWSGKECHDWPFPGRSFSTWFPSTSPCFPRSLRIPPCLESWEKEKASDFRMEAVQRQPREYSFSVWAQSSLFPQTLTVFLMDFFSFCLGTVGFFSGPHIQHFRERT